MSVDEPSSDDPQAKPNSSQPAKGEKQQPKPRSKFENILIKDEIYPDWCGLLNFSPVPLAEVSKSCKFVIDTNALLLPYTINQNSWEKTKEVFRQLASKDQLRVPSQVIREFMHRRLDKVVEIIKYLEDKKNALKEPPDRLKVPLLHGFKEYQEYVKHEQGIRDAKLGFTKALKELAEKVETWTYDDPLVEFYREVFTDAVVVQPSVVAEQLPKKLDYRYAHRIPPGFMDKDKEDKGVGDYLIWLSILKLGSDGVSVVFVSGDKKEDWVYKLGKDKIASRYELIDEFRRESNGSTYRQIQFHELLELYGADESVIKDVREKEKRNQPANGIDFSAQDRIPLAQLLQDCLSHISACEDSISNHGMLLVYAGSLKSLVEQILRAPSVIDGPKNTKSLEARKRSVRMRLEKVWDAVESIVSTKNIDLNSVKRSMLLTYLNELRESLTKLGILWVLFADPDYRSDER